MLCLSRDVGESIVIGEDGAIRIKVFRVHGGTVRLSIEAPKGVPVDRLEVHEAKKRNREQRTK